MLFQHSKSYCKSISVFLKIKSNLSNLSSKIAVFLESAPCLKDNKMSNSQGGRNLTIRVIGSGAHGAPVSVLFYGENFRTLLNCGEGTQRLLNEHKIRWSGKATHIFITDSSWKNVAGLMGVALSLQHVKSKELYLHGPKLIENVFSATNRFIDIRSLLVKFINCKTDTKYVNCGYEVQYVLLYPSTVKKLKQNISDSMLVTSSTASSQTNEHFSNKEDDEDSDCFGHVSNHKSKKKKKRSHSQVCEVKNQETVRYAMAYIFSVKESYKLLIEKCVDLNVPVGPLLNKLKNGEDITLENGNVVKSSDVVELLCPQTVVVVIECPSEDYLDSLLQEPAFYKYQSGDVTETAAAVIHFTSSNVIENPKYKDWINRFPKRTRHLFINENNTCLGSVAVHRFQYKLHAVHPEIFPLLPSGGIPVFPRNLEQDAENGHIVVEDKLKKNQTQDIKEMSSRAICQDIVYYKCKRNSFIKGETLCEIYLRPNLEYDYSRSIVLKPHIFLNEIEAAEGFLDSLKQLNSELDNMKFDENSGNRKYPKILFLGTGCSQPSIYRNPSGILIFLDNENCMLLDCGEGTYNQLIRFFGREKGRKILKKLNLIFISHLHSDHHIGLVKLLKERKSVYDEETSSVFERLKSEYQPVQLLAPIQLTKWLTFFSNHFENISHLYSVIFTSKLVEQELSKDLLVDVLNNLNFSEIKTAKMLHCPSSYGIAFTHKDNWKLTYSGDTRPSDKLVEIGMDSDVLIHEATFDDALSPLARIKAHSTISEAIDIGKQMKAKFILLTHFSQRYSHIPLVDDFGGQNISVAFDNMMVSFNQLPILPKLLPAMKCLLSKYYDDMVEKRELFFSKRKLLEQYREIEKKKAKTS